MGPWSGTDLNFSRNQPETTDTGLVHRMVSPYAPAFAGTKFLLL